MKRCDDLWLKPSLLSSRLHIFHNDELYQHGLDEEKTDGMATGGVWLTVCTGEASDGLAAHLAPVRAFSWRSLPHIALNAEGNSLCGPSSRGFMILPHSLQKPFDWTIDFATDVLVLLELDMNS